MRYRKIISDVSDEKLKTNIEKAENTFQKSLDSLCKKILKNDKLSVLTLCGPTCSGKTILSDRLAEMIKQKGRNVVTVSVDDFFLDVEDCDRNDTDVKDLDYDSPDRIDFDSFAKFKEDFFKGKEVSIPVYNLGLGKKVGERLIEPTGNDFLIVEGIQTFYPKFRRIMLDVDYKSVFISVIKGFETKDKIRFDPREIRFIRRMVRDYYFRSSPPYFTYMLWKNVVKNEEANILPYACVADYSFDSGIGYEIPLLADELTEVLSRLPEDCEYREEADMLLEKIAGIRRIPVELMPESSVCSEFIRKKEQ